MVSTPAQVSRRIYDARLVLTIARGSIDFAVLFMSMHMYLQIFPTTYLGLGHDGLYRLRHWVFAAWVILPNLSAALAFVNPRPGFMAQGGFCSLPLRPHWYRLALFWGPRYLIWCYVVFVAVRIYRYVGSEFKVFGQEKDNSSSMGVPGGSSLDRAAKAEHHRFREQRHAQRLSSLGLEQDDIDDKDCAPDDVSGMSRLSPPKTSATETSKTHPQNGSRRQSTPNVLGGIDRSGSEISTMAVMNRSCPNSRRGSHQIANAVTGEDFAAPPNPDCRGHRGSIFSLASVRSSTAQSIDESPELAPIQEGRKVSAESNQQRQNASRAMQLRRRAIQRQLRLLFIYPCIYMMLWVIPLAVNIMNYTDYFAQNPVFALGILQVICITFMTFADVVIFCWRERPWRHIPGSDGTFLGSFMWWQYCFESTWAQDRRASRAPSTVVDEKDEGDEKSQSHTGLRGSLKRWSMSLKGSSPRGSDTSGAPQVSARAAVTHKRTFSGGSDRKHREAEAAYERLALERADYENNRRSLQERRASVISQLQHAPPERKEWFDKQMDADLFQDREAVEKEERGDA